MKRDLVAETDYFLDRQIAMLRENARTPISEPKPKAPKARWFRRSA